MSNDCVYIFGNDNFILEVLVYFVGFFYIKDEYLLLLS